MNYLKALLLTLCCTTLFAADFIKPKIEKSQPSYQVGDLIVLTLKDENRPTGVAVDWLVTAGGVEVKTVKIANGVVLGTGNSNSELEVSVAIGYSKVEEDKTLNTYVFQVHDVIKIGDGGVGPAPKPIPPSPSPEPVFNDVYGLSKLAYAKAKETSMKPELAKALANNYTGVAASIVAGAVKDKMSAVQELAKLNLKSLESMGLARKDVESFMAPLEDKFFALQTDAKTPLKTLGNFADAFREVAAGLKEVK